MLKARCQIHYADTQEDGCFSNSHRGIVDKDIKPIFSCHKVPSHFLYGFEIPQVHGQWMKGTWLKQWRLLGHFADADDSLLFAASPDIHFSSLKSQLVGNMEAKTGRGAKTRALVCVK